MNAQKKVERVEAALVKANPSEPCIKVLGPDKAVIVAGTVFEGFRFEQDTAIPLHLNEKGEPGYIVGGDYAVSFNGPLSVSRVAGNPLEIDHVIGGFHYAPGGNATARAGGDSTPAINPYSVWDRNFRPACGDARGMTLIDMPGAKKFWCDIYLLGVDHLANGTSRFGVTIADGDDCPMESKRAFDRLDYATAKKVMALHGKQLLSFEEFAAAAFGVKEKSSTDDDPQVTKLDAPRTSKFGVMQATGNLWVWGHDGDPDAPRPSIFGGSWVSGSSAGSRYASLDSWPEHSNDSLGARGRSDHLQLG